MSSYTDSCEERYYKESDDEYNSSGVENNIDSDDYRENKYKRQTSDEESDKEVVSSKIAKTNRNRKRRHSEHVNEEHNVKKSLSQVSISIDNLKYGCSKKINKEKINKMKTKISDVEGVKKEIINECVTMKAITQTVIDYTPTIKQTFNVEVVENGLPVSFKQTNSLENTNILWSEGIIFQFVEDISTNNDVKITMENVYGISITIPCKINGLLLTDDELINILKDTAKAVKLRIQITEKYTQNLENIIEKIMNQRIWRVRHLIAHTTWAPVVLKYPVIRETHYSFVELDKIALLVPSSERNSRESSNSASSDSY